ncbi:MAG TPA: response regulator [Planctomycetaceae bacterium]|nr:response regulator [Planctomycetaceae bacterium]
MDTRTVLVIDNERSSLDIIESVLLQAEISFRPCKSSTEGWDIVRTNPGITSLVIRMQSEGIDGCQLTQRIRQVKSHDQFPILMIVAEAQLEVAASAIDAGATDVLIHPFEAREFRMRMNIRPAWHRRRVDAAHPLAAADNQNAKIPEVMDMSSEQSLNPVQTVMPAFDPVSLRFAYGASTEQIDAWMNDESVSKRPLDKALVCPCCGSLPSFRYGCGTCGSAATRSDSLIHHYACAHVAGEAEFRVGNSIQCPKCRTSELVAGSDFEVVPGGHECLDCHAKISEPALIGHCLACQHRFLATDAVVEQLMAFRLTQFRPSSAQVGGGFRAAKRRRMSPLEADAT